MEPKFEVFKDSISQYRFRFVAPNGEIIAASEGYVSKQACLDGIAAVKKHAPTARIDDKTNRPFGQ